MIGLGNNVVMAVLNFDEAVCLIQRFLQATVDNYEKRNGSVSCFMRNEPSLRR
jgi:hypothetical protein